MDLIFSVLRTVIFLQMIYCYQGTECFAQKTVYFDGLQTLNGLQYHRTDNLDFNYFNVK